ncbi:hypothetical protein [Paracoccus sediminicola]|uniref:hypothetical protein n=1 Tax=Paracoccus sediminicola TaxID=3017783 RepID=UPI0022F0EB2A|nr:hypothetical protein [Paracoccus sediminicola]WBU58172.1 hypothetical protein PAF18_07050 [Paracoccus sediminicola]
MTMPQAQFPVVRMLENTAFVLADAAGDARAVQAHLTEVLASNSDESVQPFDVMLLQALDRLTQSLEDVSGVLHSVSALPLPGDLGDGDAVLGEVKLEQVRRALTDGRAALPQEGEAEFF